MNTTPRTLKSTPRTRLVDLDGRVFKLKKTMAKFTISGQNQEGQKWGEKARISSSPRWHCAELGLFNLTRLEMEKELLNLCGRNLQFHNCSLDEWHL